MSVTYLIDTDWVIHYLNGHPDIVRRLDEFQGQGLGISVISLAELYEGVFYSTDPKGNEHKLNDFFRGVTVIGIDEETCKVFGKERGRLRAEKKTIGDFDLLIGSCHFNTFEKEALRLRNEGGTRCRQTPTGRSEGSKSLPAS